MDSWLHKSETRILRSLIESEDTPQSPHLCSIAMRALVLRPDLEQELKDSAFQSWVKRNLKLLAALEVEKAALVKAMFPSASHAIIDRMVCSFTPIKLLLQYCRFAAPPRHAHVSEVIRGQRRTMRWILHHHPFPALHLRREWVKQFEHNWLAALTIIPCVCTYQEELSNSAKEEIYSSNCKRPERVTAIVLADLHGLNEAGVAKLCKQNYSNTVPLSHRPLSPS